jgi:hypothetical protein
MERGALHITSKKKTLNYCMPWCSLHCFRSMARCFATSIGSESNDFFLQDVIRHRRERMDKKIFINCWRAQKLEA